MGSVWALAGKDLLLLLRDKPGFFFTVFFPVLYASFFGMIFSGEGARGGIGVIVVDEDQTDASRAFVQKLNDSSELFVRTGDRAPAVGAVRKGNAVAYVVLPQGFGEQYGQPFRGGFPDIEVGMDPSRGAEAGLLQGVLTRYMYEGLQEVFADRDRMRKMIEDSLADMGAANDMSPIARGALLMFLPALDRFLKEIPTGQGGAIGFPEFEVTLQEVKRERNYPKTSYDISFPQGIVWGMMACAATFGISLVTERTRGTLVRLQMAPVEPRRILAGKALACFAATVTVACLLFVFARLVFGVRPDSIPLLACALASAGVCFVGIMMLLSVMGKTEQSAGGIGWAVLMVMAMLGGGMLPLFAMPSWMQQLSHVSPVKWTILSMEGAIWRGFSAQEMLVPCGILVGVGVVCFLLGARVFSWAQRA